MTPLTLYRAARTIDRLPGARARLEDREARARATLADLLDHRHQPGMDEDSTRPSVPGYRVWRAPDGTVHVAATAGPLPDGWEQLAMLDDAEQW